MVKILPFVDRCISDYYSHLLVLLTPRVRRLPDDWYKAQVLDRRRADELIPWPQAGKLIAKYMSTAANLLQLGTKKSFLVFTFDASVGPQDLTQMINHAKTLLILDDVVLVFGIPSVGCLARDPLQ